MREVDRTVKATTMERSDDHDHDPDAGLELQDAVSAELKASIEDVENGGVTRSLDEVVRDQGLA